MSRSLVDSQKALCDARQPLRQPPITAQFLSFQFQSNWTDSTHDKMRIAFAHRTRLPVGRSKRRRRLVRLPAERYRRWGASSPRRGRRASPAPPHPRLLEIPFLARARLTERCLLPRRLRRWTKPKPVRMQIARQRRRRRHSSRCCRGTGAFAMGKCRGCRASSRRGLAFVAARTVSYCGITLRVSR